MWIVHIQLDRMKKILDPVLLGRMAIDEVFVSTANHNLSTRDKRREAVYTYDLVGMERVVGIEASNAQKLSSREPQAYLASDCDVLLILIACWSSFWFIIVEGNGDSGLGHSSLALLVYQLLEGSGSHLPI